MTMAQKTMQRMPDGLEEGLEKMSPTEELAVEHGQLTRILLAMDKTLKAAGSSTKANLAPIKQACQMMKQSVVDHHMKIEEKDIYPQFENTELADFVATLKSQHNEARKLVARMDELSKTGNVRDKSEMEELKKAFNDFKEMITAHAAWEETVLFPVMEGTWSEETWTTCGKSRSRTRRNCWAKMRLRSSSTCSPISRSPAASPASAISRAG